MAKRDWIGRAPRHLSTVVEALALLVAQDIEILHIMASEATPTQAFLIRRALDIKEKQ